MDQQLLVFMKTAEYLSFSRAAKELHMTQPSVSQHVQNLEQTLHVKLLERTNKRVELTKAGEIVQHHGMEILQLYERMTYLVKSLMEGTSGTLSIGSSFTYGEYILPHTIAAFQAKYPDIRPSIIILNTHDIEQRVASGELDVGIIEGDPTPHFVNAEKFATDHAVIIAQVNHPLAMESSVSREQLNDQTWIIREPGSGTRSLTEAVFAEHQIEPKSVMSFGSTQVIKESVEAGLGISLVSACTIRKELALHTLSIVRAWPTDVIRSFYVITRKSEFMTHTTSLFKSFLLTHHPK